MFYISYLKPMTRFWFSTTLLLVMLTTWGCDHSVEMPTSESVETIESVKTVELVEFASDASLVAPAAAPPGTIPLKQYWSAGSTDSLATTGAPPRPGYVPHARPLEGYILPLEQPGTILLKLFWSQGRNDFLTTTQAAPAGYQFVRNEGFIFANQKLGTVPLKLFSHAGLLDYRTTTATPPAPPPPGGGWTFVRNEGFIYPP